MAMVVTQDGRRADLQYFVDSDNGAAGGSWTLHLFVNNIVVDDTVTTGVLTEASYTGYAAQTFGAWTVPSPASGVPALASNALNNTFQPTGSGGLPQTAYGYYVIDPIRGTIIFAENFAVPFVFNSTADQLVLVPLIQVADM